MKAEEALAVAKTYVNQTLVGMGALRGAPCTIKSMTKVGRLTTTVFEWTDTSGVSHENTMLVYDGLDGINGRDGTDGTDGADGFSPTITVKSSTSSEYILTITDKEGSYDTPNLKGSGGGGGGASALTDLTDVQLASLASGDALVFNGSKWANVSLATVATSGSYNDLSDKPTIPAAQVNSDWDAASGVAQILNKPSLATVATSGDYDDLTNKPTIPAAQVNADWNAASGVSAILNKPTLAAVATSGDYNDLTDKPTIPDPQIQSDWNQSDSSAVDFIKNKPAIPGAQQSDWAQTNSSAIDYIKNKPNLATVATSGDYDDLTNKPTIPAAQVNSDWDAASGVAQILNKPTLATVATSGDYDDLSNKPTIPAAQVNSDWNAASGVAQILNKPTLGTAASKDSTNAVTQSSTDLVESGAVYDALANKADVSALNDKEDVPTVLTSTLAASATTLTFTDASIGNNSRIRAYSDPFVLGLITNMTQSGTSVTLTCETQASSVNVMLEVRN